MRWLTATTIVFGLSATLNAQHAPGEAWVTLACSPWQDRTKLTVTIHRQASDTLPVYTNVSRVTQIGTLIGAWTLPTVSFAVADLTTGTRGVYTYVPPGLPGAVAGRVDPWVVLLPPGSSYSLDLASTDFADLKKNERLDLTYPHEVTARFVIRRPSDAGGTIDSDTLTSEPLEAPLGCSPER
jgi:hypothetical protein